jgi:hypothetical protein
MFSTILIVNPNLAIKFVYIIVYMFKLILVGEFIELPISFGLDNYYGEKDYPDNFHVNCKSNDGDSNQNSADESLSQGNPPRNSEDHSQLPNPNTSTNPDVNPNPNANPNTSTNPDVNPNANPNASTNPEVNPNPRTEPFNIVYYEALADIDDQNEIIKEAEELIVEYATNPDHGPDSENSSFREG